MAAAPLPTNSLIFGENVEPVILARLLLRRAGDAGARESECTIVVCLSLLKRSHEVFKRTAPRMRDEGRGSAERGVVRPRATVTHDVSLLPTARPLQIRHDEFGNNLVGREAGVIDLGQDAEQEGKRDADGLVGHGASGSGGRGRGGRRGGGR